MFTKIKQFFKIFYSMWRGDIGNFKLITLSLLYLRNGIKLNIWNWDKMKPSENGFLPLYQLPKKTLAFSHTLHSVKIYYIDM